MKKPPMWTLDTALLVVRTLQPETRQFGYHLAMGGGVLNTGESFKDLDLYFLPLDDQDTAPDMDGLMTWLRSNWGDGENLIGDGYNSEHYKAKRKYVFGGVRIDAFFL
jgi:hypothetical protein